MLTEIAREAAIEYFLFVGADALAETLTEIVNDLSSRVVADTPMSFEHTGAIIYFFKPKPKAFIHKSDFIEGVATEPKEGPHDLLSRAGLVVIKILGQVFFEKRQAGQKMMEFEKPKKLVGKSR